ncbi:MAG: sigma-54-dependent Fis family transcriptional regulator [Candidatus Riflebacteria bacterium]|nr:sigma-54-dependent Fis family transcriptional regulator [Candidatus Riflebacteria bacterium]
MNILVVDDNRSLARALELFLKQENHDVTCGSSVAEGKAALEKQIFDLMITDLKLPDGSGIELIERARSLENPPEVILMTAFGTVETAVEAMKLGAMDYLTKPVPLEEFAFKINRISVLRQISQNNSSLQRANTELLESSGLAAPFDDIVCVSGKMSEVKELIRKAANYPSTVLFTGETGTGKEMAARALHAISGRSQKPFVRVNCASIPDTLFESELFGHEKGAFTDAREKRIGRFEAANGGSLFLDEVGEVPIHLQAKLLRALQEKEITRLGSGKAIKVDARIIAATNRDLEKMVHDGTFRSDLLYRLAVISVPIPALRERPEDIRVLAKHIVEKYRIEFGRTELIIPEETLRLLSSLKWPGNIRELKNSIERAVVFSEKNILTPELFTLNVSSHDNSSDNNVIPLSGKLIESLDRIERRMILAALERNGGVKAKASEELGISRTNLIYRMKRLELITEQKNFDI